MNLCFNFIKQLISLLCRNHFLNISLVQVSFILLVLRAVHFYSVKDLKPRSFEHIYKK